MPCPPPRRAPGETFVTDIDALQAELIDAIAAAPDLETLEAARIRALGKQGAVTALLKTLGSMTPDERRTAGPRIHGLREAAGAAIAERKAALDRAETEARIAAETLDMSLPVAEAPRGSIHPVSQVMDELA